MTDQRDPWANRSDGLRCRTCIWFARKGNGDVGRCRRHSPSMGGYPVVFESDWCGDHRLNEEVRAIEIKERQASLTALLEQEQLRLQADAAFVHQLREPQP